jgi:hypothetical protein
LKPRQMNFVEQSHSTQAKLKAGQEVLIFVRIAGLCLITLLIIRAFLQSGEFWAPLPFAESIKDHLLTVSTIGLVGALVGLPVRRRRGILYSSLAPFLVYLSWAVIQQNLLVNPDIWKLWERGWLTVALASGWSGLILAFVARTSLSFDGAEKVTSASSYFNSDKSWYDSTCEGCSWPAGWYDRVTTALHETGHWMYLHHPSLLWPESPRSGHGRTYTPKSYLRNDDLDGLFRLGILR